MVSSDGEQADDADQGCNGQERFMTKVITQMLKEILLLKTFH